MKGGRLGRARRGAGLDADLAAVQELADLGRDHRRDDQKPGWVVRSVRELVRALCAATEEDGLSGLERELTFGRPLCRRPAQHDQHLFIRVMQVVGPHAVPGRAFVQRGAQELASNTDADVEAPRCEARSRALVVPVGRKEINDRHTSPFPAACGPSPWCRARRI